MHQSLRVLSVMSVVVLSACSSMGDIQNIPAKQVVSAGIDKAFSMPNYRVVATTSIMELDLGIATEDKKATQSVISSLVKNLVKNVTFETTGVIDTDQKMYQITPTYRYDTKNMKSSVSFPLAYDGQKKMLYADFSAAEIFLNAPETEGKFSRFDLSKYSTHLDKADQIMGLFKKTIVGHYDGLDSATFSEVALNDEDKSNRVVRKVQVKSDINKSMEIVPNLIGNVVEVLKTDDKKADGAAAIELPKDMPDFADPVFKASFMKEISKMIGPGSEQTEVYGFNNKGQIVQSDVKAHIVFTPPKSKYDDSPDSENQKPVTMGMYSKMRLYDIGSAKVVDAPTVESSVDGFENLKGSLLGSIFLPKKADSSAEEAMPAAAAEPAVDAAAPFYKTRKHKHKKH